ncbi:hypothetical protein [Hydrogenimonas sp.]|jgi:multidrug efflux pump subunit AcrA (membrane-fusion protein)|uniref:efflux RND transporter periplasmic adaptor subunit n=1 Tax=Hydrogenimonas sp. TaxID=2231112 RepID=UPI00260F1ADE|nr:hypothetical protein [Hydrogenimonas sp.]
MRKSLKTLLVIAAVVLLVVGAVRAVKHKKSEEAALTPAKTYAVVVDTVRPQTGRVTLSLPALALVRNDRDTLVASKLAARILMMHKAGARVKKGEPVVRLDDRDLRAKAAAVTAQIAGAKTALAAAQTAHKTLQAKHARTQKLMKVKGASREQFDAEVSQIAQAEAKIAEAKAKIKALEANLEEIAQLLDYTLIKAPIDGVIGKTFLNPGDMAMPGKPILAIGAQKGDYLLVRLPADVNASAVLFRGEKVPLYPLHHTFNGLQEYRTTPLDTGLSTGTRVKVDAIVFDGDALRLPNDAVLDKGGRKVALRVENGRARPVDLHILASGKEGVAVADTHLAGQPLVVAKPDILLRLLGGMRVQTKKTE